MKNTIISFIIFSFVLGFVVFCNNKLINFCDNSLVICEDLEVLLNSEDWDGSYDKILELKSLMSNSFNSTSIYINHLDMDNLNVEIVKLTQYIKQHSTSDSLATLHSIRCYTEYIKELQEINLINIL